MSRDFPTLSTRHSLYAVRHRTEGLLYIGKSQNPKQRFAGGHKALVWCWRQRYDPDDMRMEATTVKHLDPDTARAFLEKLPEHIRTAFYARAAEIDYPVEAVLESAIASSLDPEALSFVDCKPGRSN